MINCDDYDYIEIVCLYRYPIKLTTKSGAFIEGVALDVTLNESRMECIKMKVGGSDVSVLLDELTKLEVQVENPHFSEINFV